MRKELTNAPAKVFVFITIPPLCILSQFYRTGAGARSSRVIPPKRRRDHDDAWQNAGIISWPQRQYRTSTRTPAFTVSLLPRMVLSPAYPAYPQTRQARSL